MAYPKYFYADSNGAELITSGINERFEKSKLGIPLFNLMPIEMFLINFFSESIQIRSLHNYMTPKEIFSRFAHRVEIGEERIKKKKKKVKKKKKKNANKDDKSP